MAARFGEVLYWLSILAALPIIALVIYAFFFGNPGFSAERIAGIVVAGLIVLVGRACRYVLAGY
jgi:hypothetical protein